MILALAALTVVLVALTAALLVKNGKPLPELDTATVSLEKRAPDAPDAPPVLVVHLTHTDGSAHTFRADGRVAHDFSDGLLRAAIACAPKREVRA